jgi:uroporphyrinogen decarboxylase
MDKLELLLQTFKGQNDTGPLFSLWKHFPNIDRDPYANAEIHVEFYNKHKFDLMKISPHGRFPVVDYGCIVADGYDPITGSTSCERCCISTVDDWETIESVDSGEGELGKQLKVVELISKDLESLPKMMTLFSPLMVASKMDPNLTSNIQKKPDLIKESLFTITDDIVEFAKASVDAGAEGIFLASQHFRKTDLPWEDVLKFEIPFIKKLISKIEGKTEFIVMHVHGQDIRFKEAAELIEVDALNWHDQITWPEIDEAASIFSKGLLAGIDETKTLVDGTKDDIKRSILDSLKKSKANENRVVIAPGCVIPITIPDENIEIISKTIRKTRNR